MGEVNRLEAITDALAKTSFVANISHELRSPLHGILGSIEFLQDTAVRPPVWIQLATFFFIKPSFWNWDTDSVGIRTYCDVLIAIERAFQFK